MPVPGLQGFPAAVAMLTLQTPLPHLWKESPLLKQFHNPVSQDPVKPPEEEPLPGAGADGDGAGGAADAEDEVGIGIGADDEDDEEDVGAGGGAAADDDAGVDGAGGAEPPLPPAAAQDPVGGAYFPSAASFSTLSPAFGN